MNNVKIYSQEEKTALRDWGQRHLDAISNNITLYGEKIHLREHTEGDLKVYQAFQEQYQIYQGALEREDFQKLDEEREHYAPLEEVMMNLPAFGGGGLSQAIRENQEERRKERHNTRRDIWIFLAFLILCILLAILRGDRLI